MLRLFNWLVSIAECLHGKSVKFASLIRQLASDLGEVFDLELDHYLLQYQVMQQHPDIYQNYVFCIEDEVVGFLSFVFYRSFFHKRGTALIEHAMHVAQELGFDEIEVGVMKEDKGALALYRHSGFDEEYLLLGREFAD